MAAPVVTIVSIDRTKISGQSGQSRVTVTFRFDQTVETWELRAGGAGVGQGTLVEQDAGARANSANCDSAVVCGVAANTNQTAYVDWDEGLAEGANEVNVYGTNAQGEATPYHQP